MKKQAVNSILQKFHCTWESIPIWGLMRNDKIIHLSFDLKKHEKLCASLKVTPLTKVKHDSLCAFLLTLLQGESITFPEDSTFIKKGSSFQQRVWRILARIPFATTRTYGDIAKELGNPQLARAVGQACNKNPLSLIIPCHRVVSAAGLGGFAGGGEIKKALLDYEQRFLKS
ncbi:MAG: methylated-DNA--[protein]-cysteine S-methyltransferase [Thermodesulfobacteriota bacterium]